ncbi:MAG TPA: agarase [Thermoguttaceae bacterium]|nr:agarase [Thermoguttaceae bacterium]
MSRLSRREMLRRTVRGATGMGLAGVLAASSGGSEKGPGADPAPAGFFTVGQRNGHWWFVAPEGDPFFSIGMNHVDPATLRYPDNVHVWREVYGGSMERWLKEAVRRDLLSWGFNTLGWAQEVVTRTPTNHRHSRNFTYDEYQWLEMPYCHMLPFADFHQWEAETRHPDFFSDGFEQWCDYVARAECAQFADDPKLIGYFYIDCPTWVHTRPENEWKGPLFDPELLKTESGRRRLLELAGRYYQVTHDAIRRYDPHHLILGDRYEAKQPVPEEVLRAAQPNIDVLSFQYFATPDRICPDFERWHELTGLPILLADASVPGARPGVPSSKYAPNYERMIRALRETPCCVGWHLCGAYLENTARRRGLRNRQNEIDLTLVEAVRKANEETTRWVNQSTGR